EIKVHGRFLSRILLRFSINQNLPTLLSVATLQEEIYTVVYDIRRRPTGVGARTVRANSSPSRQRREGRYCASRLRVRSTEHAPGCASPGAKHHRNWRLRSHRASPDRTDVHARTERGTRRPTTVRLRPSSQPRDQDFP